MKVKKSFFDLDHTKCMTAGYDGKLYPIFCEAVLPGDIWRDRADILARVTPLVQPIYGRFDLRTDFFFIPNRLIWDNWPKFISPDYDQMTDPTITFPCFQPAASNLLAKVDIAKLAEGTIADLMGCGFPTSVTAPTNDSEIRISALPFRAYHLVWNEFYRDQDLQEETVIRKGDGFNVATDLTLFDYKHANWEKDYFTTARPWAQKGGAAGVPINFSNLISVETGEPAADGDVIVDNHRLLNLGDNSHLAAETGFTIEDLRYANSLQQFLEKLSRRGSRYIETIKSFFGVITPDYRLQRPEFIGGGRQPLVISEVLQTNNNPTDETPLGTYAGHGISSGSHNFSYRASEHGYIIGLMRIVPRTSYMNVFRRDFLKFDKFDFFWPQFAHLGEQAILNKEIYVTGTSTDDDVFGYQERWAEYRYKPSQITGLFKSTSAGTIDPWHYAQKFTSLPTLNSTFIQETPPIERTTAVGSAANGQQFLMDAFFDCKMARPMPMYSVPGLIDHF